MFGSQYQYPLIRYEEKHALENKIATRYCGMAQDMKGQKP